MLRISTGRRHLRIERLDLRRPALQKKHHDRLVLHHPPRFLGPQQLRQRQPAQRQAANAQEFPAMDALAGSHEAIVGDPEHGGNSSRGRRDVSQIRETRQAMNRFYSTAAKHPGSASFAIRQERYCCRWRKRVSSIFFANRWVSQGLMTLVK